MRDPDRIPEMIELLQKIWESNPDLRLGQLIFSATKFKNPQLSISGIEDNELRQGLIRLSEELESKAR